jgi:hypothetical protein
MSGILKTGFNQLLADNGQIIEMILKGSIIPEKLITNTVLSGTGYTDYIHAQSSGNTIFTINRDVFLDNSYTPGINHFSLQTLENLKGNELIVIKVHCYNLQTSTVPTTQNNFLSINIDYKNGQNTYVREYLTAPFPGSVQNANNNFTMIYLFNCGFLRQQVQRLRITREVSSSANTGYIFSTSCYIYDFDK